MYGELEIYSKGRRIEPVLRSEPVSSRRNSNSLTFVLRCDRGTEARSPLTAGNTKSPSDGALRVEVCKESAALLLVRR